MNLDTYALTGRTTYEELAATVATILKAAIGRTPGFHLQQVQARAKGADSLQKKIEKAGGSPDADIEPFAKDLAGCRLIFYTNSDVNRLLHSRILTDNFEVDWDRTKIHHPTPGTETAGRLFMSTNYVVRLKPDRASLHEYAHLAELWCEVQVQTSLNHVWSEMEHDLIYKPPRLAGFGGRLMQGIETRLEAIMRDHLIPAGYEFQKVVDDFVRLSAGKELFDRDALKAISGAGSLNELHDLLQRFVSYVLPNYDDLDAVQADIRKAILTAAGNARGMPELPIETPLADIPGHRSEQVIALCCDVLDRLRYRGNAAVIETFGAICDLYRRAASDRERKRIVESAGRLAKNDLDVWKAAGPAVQSLILRRGSELSDEDCRLARPVLLEVLRQIVEPELSRASSTFEAVTWEHAAAPGNAALADVRGDAIALLRRLYLIAGDDSERRKVLGIFDRAVALPNRGRYSDGLVEIVFSNATEIVEFLCNVSPDQSFELLQTIEHDLLWLHRRTRVLPPDLLDNAPIVTQQTRLATAIKTFRRSVADNSAFHVYKTLVGFESVFEPEWDEDLSPSAHQKYRDKRIAELVEQVNEENAAKWLEILTRCAETRSDDMATFPSLRSFLQLLGKAKPSIVIAYLSRLTPPLSDFIWPMLLGLEGGDGKAQLPTLLEDWIRNGKHLVSMALYLNFSSEPQFLMLKKVLGAAIRAGDVWAVLRCIGAAVEKAKLGDDDFRAIFIPAVRFLSDRRDTRWVNELRFRADKRLLGDLTDEEVDLLLSAMVPLPAITYAAEELLAALVPRHADKVVAFFGSRLPFEPDEDTTRYESIPYQLHELGEALQPHAREAVRACLEWFRGYSEFFPYRGGRFIHAAFPALTEPLQSALAEVIQNGQRSDVQFVADVFQNYTGVHATHDLYKIMIEALEPDDDIIGQIESSLDSSGVIQGEFGLVEAYKSKKVEIEPWLSDPRPKVQEFARRHILSLERMIAAEQRSSEEQHEFRKRTYGA